MPDQAGLSFLQVDKVSLRRPLWHDLPQVVIHSTQSLVKKHPLYDSAKDGDAVAAENLFLDCIANEQVEVVGRLCSPNTILLAVHALETEGLNAIPRVFAHVLAKRRNLSLASGIIQSNTVAHTSASGYHRLAFPALFEGVVHEELSFLIDDFIGQGGTIANLKGYVEANGGLVLGATTLTGREIRRETVDAKNLSLTTNAFSYDGLGRVIIESTCTPRTCAGNAYSDGTSDQYDMHYSYDLAGNMIFAGRGFLAKKNAASPKTGYYYGSLGISYTGSTQPVSATSDTPVDATHPHQDIVTGMLYSPLGGVTNATVGEELGEAFSYSPRGWITQSSSLNMAGNQTLLDTETHDAHGNLLSAKDPNKGTYTYCYDSLNRLAKFSGGTTCTSAGSNAGSIYGYDAFGNQVSREAQGSGSAFQFSYVANVHNQDPSRSYDAAGNLLSDGVHNYTYDAEERISTVAQAGQYYYDAEGKRAALGGVGATPYSDFLYDLDGKIVTNVGTNFKLARTSLYVAGYHWADYTMGTGSGGGASEYRLRDQVGSFLYGYDSTGTLSESCAQAPFGEYLSCSPSIDYAETHFADNRRDAESTLDYMGARFYSSTLGRFMSPDPSGVAFSDPSNPQSWNLYSYAQNNPLTNTDPDGRECVWSDGSFDSKDDAQTGSIGGCQNAGGQYYDPSTFTAGGGQDWSSSGNAGLAQQYAANEALAASLPQGPDPSSATSSNTSTSGSTTTINLFGTNWQSTQVSTGTHPFRDNNPGDIVSGGFVNNHGAIGSDGRFGVFPSAGSGKGALDSLLHNPSYSSLSINDAVSRYAPGFENNTAGYQQFLQNAVGVSGNAPLSSLSPSQFSALENGISRYEGFNAAGNSSVTTTSVVH